MLEYDHLMPRVMAVDCLLDECATRSYEALSGMSASSSLGSMPRTPRRALRILISKEMRELEELIQSRAV